MQKIYPKLKKGFPSILLSVVFTTIGCAFFIPGTGFISTIPLITICTLIPCIIIDNYFYVPVLVFGTTFLFTFAKDVPYYLSTLPGGFALYIAAFAAIVSTIACFGVYFIKKAFKEKKNRWLSIVFAVVLITLSAVFVFILNGNPIDHMKAHKQITAEYDECFEHNGLHIGNVYYVSGRKLYACDVGIRADNSLTAVFTAKNGTVNETLSKHIVSINASEQVNKMTSLLRERFKNDMFRVSANGFVGYDDKLSIAPEADISKYISYTITIHSEETAKTFTDKVSDYLEVLEGSGVNTNTISFVGGAKQKMYYRNETEINVPNSIIINKLVPYDKTLPFSF